MEITIKGEPKEIGALVRLIQERRDDLALEKLFPNLFLENQS